MRSLKRFSSRWQNWIGVFLVSLLVLVAIAAPLISPNNPKSPGPFMEVPGLSSLDAQPLSPAIVPPLGTLPGQMDVFHALIWGTRDALSFGLVVTTLAAFVGILFGAIAGYAGGVVNMIMMRITDAFLAFPIIAGVVFLSQLWTSAIAAAGGIWDWFNKTWVVMPGNHLSPIQALFEAISPLMLILIMFSWMPYARITNVLVINLKHVEFIQAAHAIGARSSRIILRHLLPNSLTPSVVLAARDVGSMVIIQAAFTFIGLDGSSTWGNILAIGRDWILGPGGGVFAYWWVYIPATLAIVLFGIGWNLLGDGLSELLDPRDE
jgi:peptide/nickel transport system permease protein